MGQKSKLETAAVCALLCALCISHAAAAQALPDGKGKAEFVDNCTACHRADMVTAVKKTPDGWRKSVDEMASRGTPGTKEDLDNVYLYLVKNYSADKTRPCSSATAHNASPVSGGCRIRQAHHRPERLSRMPSHRATRRLHRAILEWSWNAPHIGPVARIHLRSSSNPRPRQRSLSRNRRRRKHSRRPHPHPGRSAVANHRRIGKSHHLPQARPSALPDQDQPHALLRRTHHRRRPRRRSPLPHLLPPLP